MNKVSKVTTVNVDRVYLAMRHHRSKCAGYLRKAHWIQFAEAMLARGYRVHLAEDSVKKLLTVRRGPREFGVLFKNGHAEMPAGVNGEPTTTDQAIQAAAAALGDPLAATT
jgi:hypothetical protein